MNCIGLLVFFHCTLAQPTVISDSCVVDGPDIKRLYPLSNAEVTVLTRSHKEAIASLLRNNKRKCVLK